MDTKHTPGPWTFSGAMNSKTVFVIPDGLKDESPDFTRSMAANGHGAICRLELPEVGMFAAVRDSKELANAHLIAAAPDLLAALTEFCTDVEAVGLATVEQDWPDVVHSYKKAKAAITKAEGR